jgi:glyoxylase-like metal-dependent hydrolase (beta-lactamase superfamily II)/8-oxo-dGTP pyrophosphatase MutT (NUDIX family)
MNNESDVKSAVSVILLRRDADFAWRCFWAQRNSSAPFLGGFHAFLGGRLEDEDFSYPVRHALDDRHAAQCVCAVREIFEEAAVLLADFTWLSPDAALAARDALMNNRLSFADFLQRHQVQIDARRFIRAGRWVTPRGMPRRYDTIFFAAEVSDAQTPCLWESEMKDGEWIIPHVALDAWAKGRVSLVPPTLHMLRSLARWNAEGGEGDPGWTRLTELFLSHPYADGIPSEGFEVRPGVMCIPLRTPTLPPATHTNCYIVGDRELIVIDPASPYEEEQERLERHVARLVAHFGARVKEIVLTHHHPDHMGGAARAQRTWGAPVAAHRITADLVREAVRVDRIVNDGDVIESPISSENPLVFAAPHGWRLRAVFTPGHAPGHLCFFEEATRVMITGDMIVGAGSTLVNPPEGDMRAYLASLERLATFPVAVVAGGHGPALPDAQRVIRRHIDHRLAREAQIVSALRSGATTPREIVGSVYAATPVELHALAERSVIAHLEKLIADGAIEETSPGRYAPSSGQCFASQEESSL